MKKTILTIAIVLGMTFGAFAQEKGLFGRAPQESYGYSFRDGEGGTSANGIDFGLPGSHGATDDQAAPLGGGALLLIGFGAAYALKKRNEK